jgi:hypothetical protein
VTLDDASAMVAVGTIAPDEDGYLLHTNPLLDPEPGAGLADEWETLLTVALSVDDATLIYADGAPCRSAAIGWSSF